LRKSSKGPSPKSFSTSPGRTLARYPPFTQRRRVKCATMGRLPRSPEHHAVRRLAMLAAPRRSISSAVALWIEDAAVCCQRAAWRTGQLDRNANGVVKVSRALRALNQPCVASAPRRLKVLRSRLRRTRLRPLHRSSPTTCAGVITSAARSNMRRTRRRPGVHSRASMLSTDRAGLAQTPMRRSATAASSCGTDRDPGRR
jgi:hypothetical protein